MGLNCISCIIVCEIQTIPHLIMIWRCCEPDIDHISRVHRRHLWSISSLIRSGLILTKFAFCEPLKYYQYQFQCFLGWPRHATASPTYSPMVIPPQGFSTLPICHLSKKTSPPVRLVFMVQFLTKYFASMSWSSGGSCQDNTREGTTEGWGVHSRDTEMIRSVDEYGDARWTAIHSASPVWLPQKSRRK